MSTKMDPWIDYPVPFFGINTRDLADLDSEYEITSVRVNDVMRKVFLQACPTFETQNPLVPVITDSGVPDKVIRFTYTMEGHVDLTQVGR